MMIYCSGFPAKWLRVLLVVLCFYFSNYIAYSQTSTIVYSEDFNSGTNGWVIGGYNPSWSHGIPSLPNITSNGTLCFVTGDAGAATSEPFTACSPVFGATVIGNYYNCCERSFVASPTIDLTGVNSPLLSLDINLHCEQTFDGAKVQISVNGGNSWIDVGVLTSSSYQTFPSSLNCREQNWYNKNSISYLSNTGGGCGAVSFALGGSNSGWSGGCSQAASGACTGADSHGTNGWVTSSHCIPQAANKNNVKIRVGFGAGSQVYADGIAFDNVTITDVFPVVNFTEAIVAGCEPQLSFSNLTDCAETYNWDFGHPGFPGNNSALANPSHIFPLAGNYNITLTATDFCGGVKSFVRPVAVLPGNGPVITTVNPTSSGLCNSATDSLIIQLNAPNPASGPYLVAWTYEGNQYSENGVTGNPLIISGLAPGVYENITIEDANGCIEIYDNAVIIPLISDGISVDAGNDAGIEIGNSIQLNAFSNLTADFTWQPGQVLDDPLIASPVASPETTTVFTVTATSVNGCTASDQVTISVRDENPCNRFYVPNSFTPNDDGKNEKLEFVSDPSMRIAEFNLMIFNRWGELVFNSEEPGKGWDGSDSPEGIYAIVIQVTCFNKKSAYYSKSLSLIR